MGVGELGIVKQKPRALEPHNMGQGASTHFGTCMCSNNVASPHPPREHVVEKNDTYSNIETFPSELAQASKQPDS